MTEYHRRSLDDRDKHRRWLDPRLYSVRVAQLRAYLLHQGWKAAPPDRPGFLVFEEPTTDEAEPLYQFVPESEDWEGYPAQLYDLIAAIAEVEDRYAGDVLTDILREAAAVEPDAGAEDLAQHDVERLAGQIDWGRARKTLHTPVEWFEGDEPKPF